MSSRTSPAPQESKQDSKQESKSDPDFRVTYEASPQASGTVSHQPAATFPIDSVIYRDPATGGLLRVRHDIEALKRVPAETWKARFDARFRSTKLPDASGVWSKREWVMPWVTPDNIVSLFEGYTPLMSVPRMGKNVGSENLMLKLCGNSHTGSFKDLGMTVLVSVVNQLIQQGKPIRAIACASTGDTSAALSAFCARANIPSVVLLPRGKVTTAQLIQPLAGGSVVCEVDTDFDGCMAIMKQLADEPVEATGLYLANSMNSLRLEGQKSIAIEIAQQLDWQVPDWVIVPSGNLGNIAAFAAGFDMLHQIGLVDKRPRLCVAQAEAANPLYRAFKNDWRFEPVVAQETAASAIRIGNPVSIHRAVAALKDFNGIVEQASETELAEAAAVADREGAYTCPHTGVALAVFIKLTERKIIQSHETTVVISTANGLKFTDFKTDYHDGKLTGVKSSHANVPLQIENDYQKVKAAIMATLDQRK